MGCPLPVRPSWRQEPGGCSGKGIPCRKLRVCSTLRSEETPSFQSRGNCDGPWPILAPNCPRRAPNCPSCARPEVPPYPRQLPPSNPTHARPSVSSSQGLPRGEATPAPPATCHPTELAVPCSTYRLRTSSGSEMAREASAGTRAGAVRAGILEAATEVSAAQAALAFRAETDREGLAEVARTTPARAWGKAGRTTLRELVTVADRPSRAWCAQGGAHARDGCAPPRGAVDLSEIQRLLQAFCLRQSFIHSFQDAGNKKGRIPTGFKRVGLEFKFAAPLPSLRVCSL